MRRIRTLCGSSRRCIRVPVTAGEVPRGVVRRVEEGKGQRAGSAVLSRQANPLLLGFDVCSGKIAPSIHDMPAIDSLYHRAQVFHVALDGGVPFSEAR